MSFELEVRYVQTESVVPYPFNACRHSKKQISTYINRL